MSVQADPIITKKAPVSVSMEASERLTLLGSQFQVPSQNLMPDRRGAGLPVGPAMLRGKRSISQAPLNSR